MYKVNVINTINNRTFGPTFETLEEVNEYVASQEVKAQQGIGWGWNTRSILKSECPETHLGLVLSEETRIDEISGEELIYVNLDKEYTIQIDDITAQVETEAQIQEALKYLKETDFYYARKLETNEDVPVNVVSERISKRNFLRSNGY